MKFIFFDIEGANPGLSRICTFGYVVADENFRMIEKRDIPINPRSRYDWYVEKNILQYKKSFLNSQPDFSERYGEISALLLDGDTTVLGYSIMNDLIYLNSECKRYGKPSLNFGFFDIQVLMNGYLGEKNQVGIEKASAVFGLVGPATAHRSDDDAEASMMVLKALCEKSGQSLTDFLLSSTARGFNENYDFYCEFAPNLKPHLQKRSRKPRKRKLPAAEGAGNVNDGTPEAACPEVISEAASEES